MSRLYEMTVEIRDFNERNLNPIIEVCCRNWAFARECFLEQADPLNRYGVKIACTAQGVLGNGESDKEFSKRLALAIWNANEGFCRVKVRSVYLEEPPRRTYTYDEDDYDAIVWGLPGKE